MISDCFTKFTENVECQVLVPTGDQNPVHTLESAKRTAAAIQPNKLNFHVFPGAGSPVYADREKEVALLINQYFKKLFIATL
jgi:hypothetical protein